MAGNTGWAKILRILGIVLMGLAAAFTLMGGVGTSCVALAAEKWESMAALAPYKWLYGLFVLVTTAIGVLGVRATVNLAKGKPGSYKDALIALAAGVLVGVIHIAASRALRGKSMPVDMVVYVTVVTLIVFLIYRIPGLWRGVNFDRSARGGGPDPVGMAFTLLVCGALILSAPLWAGASHTFSAGGINWAAAWPLSMNGIGALLVLGGLGWLAKLRAERRLSRACGNGELEEKPTQV